MTAPTGRILPFHRAFPFEDPDSGALMIGGLYRRETHARDQVVLVLSIDIDRVRVRVVDTDQFTDVTMNAGWTLLAAPIRR